MLCAAHPMEAIASWPLGLQSPEGAELLGRWQVLVKYCFSLVLAEADFSSCALAYPDHPDLHWGALCVCILILLKQAQDRAGDMQSADLMLFSHVSSGWD